MIKKLVLWSLGMIGYMVDCYAPDWQKGLNVGDAIPDHLINNLPCPTGESLPPVLGC
jgi:hypothetical protein